MDLAHIAAVIANITTDQVLFALCWIYVIGVCYRLACASVDQDQHYRERLADFAPMQEAEPA